MPDPVGVRRGSPVSTGADQESPTGEVPASAVDVDSGRIDRFGAEGPGIGEAPVADAGSVAGDDGAVVPIEPGDREVVGLRDASSKTFETQPGTYTTEFFPEPVHVKEDGGWVDIDTTLEETTGGDLSNGAAPLDVTVTPSAGDEPFSTVETPTGESVAYSLAGADFGAPEVSGSKATFADVGTAA